MQGNRFSINYFSMLASSQGQGYHNSKWQLLRATLPLNFLCGRKPLYPEKTNDFRQSKFLVRSHGEYNTNLALWNHHVIISANEDPSLRIESFAIINLRGDATKPNFSRVLTYSFHMRTELKRH